ncbi:MAG: DNA repair protein RadA [Caldimicrobium sp.]
MSFYCVNCGYRSTKWLGRCPQCGGWDTLVEEKEEKRILKESSKKPQVLKIKEINFIGKERILTGLKEFDFVLGGGIVPSSLILIGGDPGIGKSTLLTQTASLLSEKGYPVLYVSSEESAEQVKLRTERLALSEDFYFFSETDLSVILSALEEIKPEVVIIDSIQTVFHPALGSSPGSISQVRECANILMRIAKEKNITIFLVGHITKEGFIAGPKILEHLVDVVLYLEGERETGFRILRAIKNRFGALNEIGVFVMTERGLLSAEEYEEFFYTGEGAPFVILEGTRPILVEVQALVTKSFLALPRRQAVGFDPVRLSLLCAILEKKLGFNFGDKDVYLKVAGGLKVKDPSSDLAVAVSLIASLLERDIPKKTLFLGEIGLLGELRPVREITLRLKEAEKKGFERAFLPKVLNANLKDLSLEIYSFKEVNEVLKILFDI